MMGAGLGESSAPLLELSSLAGISATLQVSCPPGTTEDVLVLVMTG